MLRSRTAKLLVALAVVVSVDCGTTMPSHELITAREAYQSAGRSRAPELAPSQLDDAKKALERAEAEFQDDSNSQRMKDLAYVAQRKAELAVSAANLAEAEQQRVQANKDRQKAQEALLGSATSAIRKTKAQLEKERLEKGQLKKEGKRTKAQLAAERKRRKAAEKKLAAAIASIAEIARVKEEARGTVITLSGAVLFATGKWTLLPLAQQKLSEVAKALKDADAENIIVEGHTDSRGSGGKNQTLSERRANAVRDYLIREGISPSNIRSVGIGEDRPIASNKTADGRANNRRVEIIVPGRK